MITNDPKELLEAWGSGRFPALHSATAKALMFITPEGFRLSEQSASDNVYMDLRVDTEAARALAEHRELVRALDRFRPVVVFPGHEQTPDAVFCNNAHGTVLGKLIVGAMRHADRQRETQRSDIQDWFARRMGYPTVRVAHDASVVAELTGPLVIDRSRGVGFCGLSERCNRAGAEAMHAAFGLSATFCFDLVPGEYHSNVVLSVLAGRAVVLHRASCADPAAAEAIAACYAPHVIWLSDAEKAAFCGNCIAPTPDTVWMSAAADAALSDEHRAQLADSGFALHSVALPEIEKAGGSLRCCVGEIF